jgi:hypothetical protein
MFVDNQVTDTLGSAKFTIVSENPCLKKGPQSKGYLAIIANKPVF